MPEPAASAAGQWHSGRGPVALRLARPAGIIHFEHSVLLSSYVDFFESTNLPLNPIRMALARWHTARHH